MLVCSAFPLTLSLPFQQLTSLPGWNIPQLGLLVVREVECSDSSTRVLV